MNIYELNRTFQKIYDRKYSMELIDGIQIDENDVLDNLPDN